MRADTATLEQRIGHRFSDAALLRRALTHSSLANEARAGGVQVGDNEQLEFLGDSVLGFLVADAHLHGVARRLEIGAFLELGRSEEMSGGRAKKTLLVDALEAVIAAIYLDGGSDAARRFVHGHILDAPLAEDADAGTDIQPAIANFKSALQELAQSRGLPQPRYAIVRERGPEHSKIFTVEVRLGREWSGQADGRTKKVAAQRAARAVYERLRQDAIPEPAPRLETEPRP